MLEISENLKQRRYPSYLSQLSNPSLPVALHPSIAVFYRAKRQFGRMPAATAAPGASAAVSQKFEKIQCSKRGLHDRLYRRLLKFMSHATLLMMKKH